jgi:hypothetical protein
MITYRWHWSRTRILPCQCHFVMYLKDKRFNNIIFFNRNLACRLNAIYVQLRLRNNAVMWMWIKWLVLW